MITTPSATKVSDGTALTAPNATIEGLVNGETATVTATTNAQNNGMSGNPGGQGGIPGQQPPTGGFGG